MEEDFHIGDVVCLKWDKTKRFCVSNKEGPGKIGGFAILARRKTG